MKYRNHLYIIIVTLFVICLPLQAQEKTYDKQHPLIIAGDWDKPPYEFLNDEGEPTGSNIDLMRAIMKKLDIPCRFLLKEWGNAIRAFERGEADLILANANRYQKAPYCYTNNIINYNRIRALMIGDSVPPLSVRQLVDGGVVLKPSDYSLAYFLAEDSAYSNHIDFQSPKVALMGLHDKDYKFFVWGEEPLKWKIREFNMENEGFILCEVDIPVSEIHVIGRNQKLISDIDDIYSRMKQNGDVETIKNRWLHPGQDNGDSRFFLSAAILLGILLLTLFCYLLNRLAQSHVQRASRHSTELNEMMAKALHMGRFYVMLYDIAHDKCTNHYGTFLPDKGMSLKEALEHIHPTQQKEFMQKIDMMLKGREQKTAITIRWNSGTPEQPQWLSISGHSMVEYDDDGHPAYIINTFNDITKNVADEKATRELARKYERLINIPRLSMSFYDKDGSPINANESMKSLCEFDKPENERYFHHTNMFDVPLFRELFSQGRKVNIAACHRMEKPDSQERTYIEFEIRPLLNEQKEVFNYIVSSVDVTEEHDRDVDMHQMNREIETAVGQLNKLEKQLRYILENTNMYVWQMDFSTQRILYTRRLKTPEYAISFEEYLDMVVEEERTMAKMQLDSAIWEKPFSTERHFQKAMAGKDLGERWYNITGIPIRNTDGDITGVFGMIRDITEQKESQRKLEEETLRAESSGQQKSVFLASMTHELRTPLNSIVGFSDLLRTIHEPGERQDFIRIIRTQCDILLRLISDILEASNISDTEMQIIPRIVDFASEFDNMCQSLAQRVDNPDVTFSKKNPHTTLKTRLDMGRIQQVVTNFVTNAVKYTKEGHICVGYEVEQRNGTDGLYVYCEDTGSGIPEEKQHAIFDRFVKLNEFVQGTGLGLSICKNIIELCKGQIGVNSEVGKGSTFWFWIPVELY